MFSIKSGRITASGGVRSRATRPISPRVRVTISRRVLPFFPVAFAGCNSRTGVPAMLEAAVLQTPAGTPLLLDMLVCRLGVSFLDQFSSRIPADVRAKCDPWDVLQDTLVRALTSLDRFQGASEEDLLHWLRVLYRSR